MVYKFSFEKNSWFLYKTVSGVQEDEELEDGGFTDSPGGGHFDEIKPRQ